MHELFVPKHRETVCPNAQMLGCDGFHCDHAEFPGFSGILLHAQNRFCEKLDSLKLLEGRT